MRAQSCRRSAPTRRALFALALAFYLAPTARAEPTLTADLSAHQMTIAPGSAGTVTLFGTTDAPGDIVVIVRGPEAEAVVRRGPFDNFWLTAHRVAFAGVPGFYAVYASAQLDTIVSPTVQALHQIGLANLRFQLQSTEQDPTLVQESRAALIAERERAGVYVGAVGKVSFDGNRLFHAALALPSRAPAGTYFIEVLQLQGKALVGGQTMSLVVATPAADTVLTGFAGWSALLFAAFVALVAIVAAGAVLRWRRRQRPVVAAVAERPARPAKRGRWR
jgi:uncharacterized protein (TIGR02186 family)